MKWIIDQSSLPAYVHIALDGEFTSTSNRKMWDEITALKRWKPGTSVLIDARQADRLGQKGHEFASEAAYYFARHKNEFGTMFIAVYNVSHEFYEYAREFQHNLILQGSDVRIQNFPDKESAARWLRHLAAFSKANNNHLYVSNSA